MGLYKKYAIIIFIVFVVCIAAMWFCVISPALRTIETQSIHTYENMVDMSAAQYKETFDNIERISYSFLAFNELYSVLAQNNTKKMSADYTTQLANYRTLISHFLFRPDIYSIAFYDLNNNVIIQTQNSISDENLTFWYKAAPNLGGRPMWSDVYKSFNVLDPHQTMYVISLVRIINNPDTFRQVGTMRLTLTEGSLYNVIGSLNTQDKRFGVFLCDAQGFVMSAADKSAIGSPLQYIKPDILSRAGDGAYYLPLSRFSYIIREIPGYSMYVVARIDSALLYRSSLQFSSYTKYIIIILLVFVSVFTIFTSRFIVKPIRTLAGKMNEVRTGNFDIQVGVNSRDEVGMLTETFNQMTRSLKTLMKNMLEAKQKESEMKLESLRIQIHPHFLLNTLDNIRWTARKNGDTEVEYYVETLSRMMRKNLYTDSPISSVSDELDAAMAYITLQQKRFGKRLKYFTEVPEELYDNKVLTFVLQPILENSIEHGFDNKLGDCTIYLIIEKKDEDIVIDVTDDGKGTDEELVRAIIKGEVSIPRISALKNLHERITLRFGSDYHGGVGFYSTPGIGTRVVVTMPADPAHYKEQISL